MQNKLRLYLLAQLNDLLTRHEQIGAIRGLGLIIGIEIVSNTQEKTPRRDLAKYIVERMKDHGILLSTDGPKDNVIKIKPPLVFDKTDAMRLIQALERILVEDFVVT